MEEKVRESIFRFGSAQGGSILGAFWIQARGALLLGSILTATILGLVLASYLRFGNIEKVATIPTLVVFISVIVFVPLVVLIFGVRNEVYNSFRLDDDEIVVLKGSRPGRVTLRVPYRLVREVTIFENGGGFLVFEDSRPIWQGRQRVLFMGSRDASERNVLRDAFRTLLGEERVKLQTSHRVFAREG